MKKKCIENITSLYSKHGQSQVHPYLPRLNMALTNRPRTEQISNNSNVEMAFHYSPIPERLEVTQPV